MLSAPWYVIVRAVDILIGDINILWSSSSSFNCLNILKANSVFLDAKNLNLLLRKTLALELGEKALAEVLSLDLLFDGRFAKEHPEINP